MIYELARSVETLMRERNFPVSVVFGPERSMRAPGTSCVIVIEDDDDAPDEFGAPMGTQRNPRKVAQWSTAVRAVVYARSSLPGAHHGDHQRECRRFVAGLIAAIDRWTTAERCDAQFSGGGMLPRGVFGPGFEQFPGVAYLFRFRLPVAVFDFVYTPESEHTPGEAQTTYVVEDVSNTVTASQSTEP